MSGGEVVAAGKRSCRRQPSRPHRGCDASYGPTSQRVQVSPGTGIPLQFSDLAAVETVGSDALVRGTLPEVAPYYQGLDAPRRLLVVGEPGRAGSRADCCADSRADVRADSRTGFRAVLGKRHL